MILAKIIFTNDEFNYISTKDMIPNWSIVIESFSHWLSQVKTIHINKKNHSQSLKQYEVC